MPFFHSKPTCAILVPLVFFVFFSSPVQGTEYYAFRLVGSDCILCHSDARNGSLNETGLQFQQSGHRYPWMWQEVGFWLMGTLTLFLILFGMKRRSRLWRTGKREGEWERLTERWKGLLLDSIGHRNILRRLFPGLSHFLVFGSVLVLGFAVLIILFQEYFYFPLSKARLFHESSYPWLRLVLDLAGMVGLVGTLLLAFRRYIQRPRELDSQSTDAIALSLLFFVFLTGSLVTGIRNHLYQSPWSGWAPTASLLSSVLTQWVLSEDNLKRFLAVLWWLHFLLSLSFLSYIPCRRLIHLFASPLNIFFRNLNPKGALKKLDLEASESFGVEKLEEFTWRNLLEFDACTRCGRCQEACPAFLTEKHLNPKRVIQNLKRSMETGGRRKGPGQLIGGVVTEDEIWECTTCRNCLEHCPVYIEPMAKLLDFRRNLVLQRGKIPKETHFAFRNIERKGNPWGFDPSKRMWWVKEMGVREISAGEEVDFLFWVGCYSSYDDRNIQVATSLVKILEKMGVNFGVLGIGEWCCGIDLRRMGSEYLFQVTVEKNLELLQRMKFQKILTTCPHCFNTLRNEYSQFGVSFEVLHYTSLLDQWIQQDRMVMNRGRKDMTITYHDSCYLGRYNGGYDPPRSILKAMPGITVREMERTREKSFCCGGGGCHMWMEEKTGKRINQARIEEATKTEAEIVATVCPLCLISLDSAVKVLNLDTKIRVLDILELVGERMKD